MAKRAANGNPQPRKRADGRWIVSISVGIGSNGKATYKHFYGKTSKEALDKLNTFKSEYSLGNTDHTGGSLKMSEWLWLWLNKYKVELAPTTRTSYSNNIRLHIEPYVGGVALNKLTRGQLQLMLDTCYDDGKNSLSLFIKVYNVANGALEKAVELGYIAKNPIKGVAFPKDNAKKIKALTQEEQKAFIGALEGEDSRALFLTYLFTGARLGELPAITWQDIDLNNFTLYINKKVVVTHDIAADKKTELVVQDFLKTRSSRRKVVFPMSLAVVLEEHKQKQKQLASDMEITWSEDCLVFPVVRGRCDFGIAYPRNIQEKFARIARNAGLDGISGVHILRHTYATRCFEADIDVKVISAQLGHKSVKTTYDIYVDVIQSKAEIEVSKLDALECMIA